MLDIDHFAWFEFFRTALKELSKAKVWYFETTAANIVNHQIRWFNPAMRHIFDLVVVVDHWNELSEMLLDFLGLKSVRAWCWVFNWLF